MYEKDVLIRMDTFCTGAPCELLLHSLAQSHPRRELCWSILELLPLKHGEQEDWASDDIMQFNLCMMQQRMTERMF
jgi:hypothetical protein